MARSNSTSCMKQVALGAVLSLCLAACSDFYYDRRDSVHLSAGDANANNIAVQTIDPWPREAANRTIHTNGEVSQKAIERYRQGKVIQPRGLGTSSVEVAPTNNGPAVQQ
ncbi:MAG TPA: hypothetical protein PKB01_00740 [Xanthobacteraceae bacterium]|nr:hypothetical protein [Xanthobacteraceae bacterium]